MIRAAIINRRACFRFLFSLDSLKYLKLVYTIIYFQLCIVLVSIYIITNSKKYNEILNEDSVDLHKISSLIDIRGVLVPENSKNDAPGLRRLIKKTGVIHEIETTNSFKVSQNNASKSDILFNSAGEFLELVEDSQDRVWLIQITYENHFDQSSQILSKNDWEKLGSYLDKFDILSGSFNCNRDLYFCHMRGWNRPKLILGLPQYDNDKVSRELFAYDEKEPASEEKILKWIEFCLRKRLLESNNNKIHDAKSSLLKLYYVQSENKSELPLYFLASSIKHTRNGAKFELLEMNASALKNCTNWNNEYALKTPLILVFRESFCLNYGSNFNELANYQTLNLFLMFLYPDLNHLFLLSLSIFNTYLFFIFFEYKTSLAYQIFMGLLYICTIDFVLFSFWLIVISNSMTNWLLNLALNKLIILAQNFLFYNDFSSSFLSKARFFLYFFVYINPFHVLQIVYCLMTVCFYFHTKFLYDQNKRMANSSLLPIIFENKEERTLNRERNHSTLNNVAESDSELYVSDLINQINGLTSIWLQSSTLADKLILELPNIEICKCLKRLLNRVNRSSFEYNKYLSSCSSLSEDDLADEMKRSLNKNEEISCACGKNSNELKLKESNLIKFNRECSICLEKYSIGCVMIMLPCGHYFHRKCLYEWFMNSTNCKCPFCRTSMQKFKKSI